MNKRIVKRYKLKEPVEMLLCFIILGAIIWGALYFQSVRVENLDKNNIVNK